MELPPYTPTVPGMLHHISTHFGDVEALVCGADRLTYRGLEQRSARLANAMLAQGLGKGSRVAILMKNSPDFAVTFMAAARIGALVSPLSTLFQAPELAWVLRHADINTLFMDSSYLGHDYLDRMELAFPALRGAGSPRLRLVDAPFLRHVHVYGQFDRAWATDAGKLLDHPNAGDASATRTLQAVESEVCPADLFFVVYTSGSTGLPKGVVHYHGNAIRHSYRMAAEYMMLEEGDRIASARPWFWIAGLSANLLYTLQVGGCLVIQERDDPHTTMELIDTEDVTFISGRPPQFATLAATMDAEQSPYSFRLLGNNTAGVVRRPPDAGGTVQFINERLEGRIPARKMNKDISHFASFYGMSETLAAHTAWPQPNYLPHDKVPSSGRAMSGVEHKIVDQASGALLGADQPGELYVRGYSLMQGLYKREREETFDPDGFYPSGDICVIDADGYLRVRGRMDDMTKISGANVSLTEVEQVLNLMPGVRTSAVFALQESGESGSNRLVAGVLTIPAAPINEEQVIAYLKSQLSSFKVPRRVLLFDPEDVPHTGSGKVIRREFQALIEQALEE